MLLFDGAFDPGLQGVTLGTRAPRRLALIWPKGEGAELPEMPLSPIEKFWGGWRLVP